MLYKIIKDMQKCTGGKYVSDILLETKNMLLELLSCKDPKSTEHLVEELKVEFPALYQEIRAYFSQKYNLSGCGAQMSPLTAVQQCLSELYNEGKAISSNTKTIVLWCKSPS